MPFTHGYRLNAVFPTSNNLKPNSPVRIAGVNVGKVKKIERYKDSDYPLVRWRSRTPACRSTRTRTAKIRPRIFLEGNFFVDLHPGTPSRRRSTTTSARCPSRRRPPRCSSTRCSPRCSRHPRGICRSCSQLGKALTSQPAGTQGSTPRPGPRRPEHQRGRGAAEQLHVQRRALKNAVDRQRGAARARADDLSKLITGRQLTSAGLGRNESQLQDLITQLQHDDGGVRGRAATTCARRSASSPPTLATANTALDALNRASRRPAPSRSPSCRASTRPPRRSRPPSRGSRRSAARAAQRAAAARPAAQGRRPRSPRTHRRRPSSCCPRRPDRQVRDPQRILPAGDMVINEGTTSPTGTVELQGVLARRWSRSPARARTSTATACTSASSPVAARDGLDRQHELRRRALFGNDIYAPLGTRPATRRSARRTRPDVACYKNAVPDINGAKLGPGEKVVSDRARRGRAPPTDAPTTPASPRARCRCRCQRQRHGLVKSIDPTDESTSKDSDATGPPTTTTPSRRRPDGRRR